MTKAFATAAGCACMAMFGFAVSNPADLKRFAIDPVQGVVYAGARASITIRSASSLRSAATDSSWMPSGLLHRAQ